MEQERQQKRPTRPRGEGDEAGADLAIDSKASLKKETDELLEEIDELLEENAEEFVRNYIQKGGQ